MTVWSSADMFNVHIPEMSSQSCRDQLINRLKEKIKKKNNYFDMEQPSQAGFEHNHQVFTS